MFEIDAAEIRRLMFAAKLNTLDLAKVAGVSKGTAAKVLRDGAKATFAVIGKIANALNVDGNTLILHK